MARRHLNWITVGRCRAAGAGGRADDDGWRGGALCTLGDEEQQLELETNIREVLQVGWGRPRLARPNLRLLIVD